MRSGVGQHAGSSRGGEVNDEGELTKATMEGVFYPQSDPMTYTVDFSDYGTTKDILAPAQK